VRVAIVTGAAPGIGWRVASRCNAMARLGHFRASEDSLTKGFTCLPSEGGRRDARGRRGPARARFARPGLAVKVLDASGYFQHYLPSRMSLFVEFESTPCVREREHSFNHWFQFPGVDKLCNLGQL
jgi:hypothetical protein